MTPDRLFFVFVFFRRTHRCELIKLAEELVEELDELLSGALGGQAGETHDVCEQDAARREKQAD